MTRRSTTKGKAPKGKAKAPKRSREEWLEAALEALSHAGEGRVRVQHLAASLGVTTGSLYWHFKNRADLVREMLRYWHDEYTLPVIEQITRMEGTPAERLNAIARVVISSDAARYDIAIRAWATHEAGAAQAVRRTDKVRMKLVASILEDLDFSGDDLNLRVRVFLAFLGLGDSVGTRRSKAGRLDDARRLVAMLTDASSS